MLTASHVRSMSATMGSIVKGEGYRLRTVSPRMIFRRPQNPTEAAAAENGHSNPDRINDSNDDSKESNRHLEGPPEEQQEFHKEEELLVPRLAGVGIIFRKGAKYVRQPPRSDKIQTKED